MTPLRLTVQAGATTGSFTATATLGSNAWTWADTANTTDSATVIPILANGSLTSFSYVSATNILTVNGSFPAYPAGTIIRLNGLGVGTYLVGNATTDISLVVQAGATTSSFAATVLANGSAWSHADIANTTDSGLVISPGHNYGYVWFDSTHGPWANNGTPGNTFVQDLQAANPDIYVCFLGTNDGSRTIGSSTDLPGAASEYGDVKALIESVKAAKPTVKLMWLTPYLQSRSNVVAAQVTACGLYGVPVLDLMHGSEMDNPFTWQIYLLTTDHTHPSATGQPYLGAVSAEFIKQHV
jgi:hypothetical protein